MAQGYRYTRDQLEAAVAASHSWRGVLRALGRSATSAGVRRAVQRQAEAFGIDHSHFTGQRRWNDGQLRIAISESRIWSDVMQRLGLSGGNHVTVRAHAARLGIDTSHFGRKVSRALSAHEPQQANLRVAGPTLAAAWFMLRGYQILWPLEPCRYDLAVPTDGAIQRIQVKTATYRSQGSFIAQLSNSRRPGHREVYDIDEIDSFFVIDAELNAYWIPFMDVCGYGQISLRSYRDFLVAERGQLLRAPGSDTTH